MIKLVWNRTLAQKIEAIFWEYSLSLSLSYSYNTFSRYKVSHFPSLSSFHSDRQFQEIWISSFAFTLRVLLLIETIICFTIFAAVKLTRWIAILEQALLQFGLAVFLKNTIFLFDISPPPLLSPLKLPIVVLYWSCTLTVVLVLYSVVYLYSLSYATDFSAVGTLSLCIFIYYSYLLSCEIYPTFLWKLCFSDIAPRSAS